MSATSRAALGAVTVLAAGYLSVAGAATAGATVTAACPPTGPRFERCLTLWQRQTQPRQQETPSQPVGWGPAAIEDAYKLPLTAGAGQTVAIIEAFDTPSLLTYVNEYRAQYRLPACDACLRKVNQKGQATPLPPSSLDTGWDLEATLDADMVSAACRNCRILVVEATSPSIADLAAATNTAARLGAQVISASFGTRESGFTQAYAASYAHPGHMIVASSGDVGFGPANFPANLATVTAAGGTELSRSTMGWTERVWNNQIGASGSGCSAWVAKPAWQPGTDCGTRAVADVSALATNVAIYEKDYGGWGTVSGTSAAAPIIAGVYALAGNATMITPGHLYAHAAAFNDVTTGDNDPYDAFDHSDGAICGYDYLCMAKRGYDAPTGLGTPDGTGAF